MTFNFQTLIKHQQLFLSGFSLKRFQVQPSVLSYHTLSLFQDFQYKYENCLISLLSSSFISFILFILALQSEVLIYKSTEQKSCYGFHYQLLCSERKFSPFIKFKIKFASNRIKFEILGAITTANVINLKVVLVPLTSSPTGHEGATETKPSVRGRGKITFTVWILISPRQTRLIFTA